jgi:phage tail sheath protein FI
MPSDYHHGVRVIELNAGTRPIRVIESAIIGMVCTANDADPDVFPLNKPVLKFGTRDLLDKAGTTGTLSKSLDAIKDQCEPIMMIVRVEEDSDDYAQTISNVMGGMENGRRTGLQALLSCKQMFGYKPRILGAPGYDKHQTIANELGIIAEKLRGFAYVGVDANTPEDAVLYRNNFGNKRIMLIWPEFTGWSRETNSEITISASARALGLRSKIDDLVGWHKTLSNVPVNGVEGISQDVYWDLQATTTESDYLNRNEVTTLINENGYRFWGSRTTTADPLFAFENYVRSGDILADTMAEAHFWAVDKPMSLALVKDIIEGINSKFKWFVNNGYLLGGECWFDDKYNSKETMKAGQLTLDYDYTPVPPLEDLKFQQRITDTYILDLIDALVKA